MPSKLSSSFVGLGCLTPIFGVALLGYFIYHQSFTLGIFVLGASITVSIILFVLVSKIESKRKRVQMKFLQTFQPNRVDFQKLKSFTSSDLLTKIAIDQQHKKIYLWVPDSNENITKAFVGMPYAIKTYDFSDLLAILFTEDGHQMASAQKDTHYTSFLLNKIREEDAPTNQSTYPPVDKINFMALEVIVNDNTRPKHRIHFYYEPHRKIQKDSLEYEAIHKECQKWFRLLETIVNATEQNVMEQHIERSFETMDANVVSEKTFSEPMREKKTQITIDIDTTQPAFRLSEKSHASSKEILETEKDDCKQDKAVKKPTSYFEQLVEKNRRQLRGDYSDE